VSAASEKYFDQVQPPSDICTFRCGYITCTVRESNPEPAD